MRLLALLLLLPSIALAQGVAGGGTSTNCATPNGVCKASSFTSTGGSTFGSLTVNGNLQASQNVFTTPGAISVFGNTADAANAVGTLIGAGQTLNTPGAVIVGFDVAMFSGPVLRAAIDRTGSFNGSSVLSSKRTGQYLIGTTSDTAFIAIGLPALATIAGTPTAAPTADGTRHAIKYASGAVSGNVAGVQANGLVTTFAYQPRSTIVFRTDSAIATQRIFVGLAASDLSGVTTLAGLNTIRLAAIRYDTGLSDTVFQCVTSDGTTASTQASSVTVAINTTYTVTIDVFTTGHVGFFINGAMVCDKTSNVPTGTTGIAHQASLTTLTTAAENIYLSRFQLDQN